MCLATGKPQITLSTYLSVSHQKLGASRTGCVCCLKSISLVTICTSSCANNHDVHTFRRNSYKACYMWDSTSMSFLGTVRSRCSSCKNHHAFKMSSYPNLIPVPNRSIELNCVVLLKTCSAHHSLSYVIKIANISSRTCCLIQCQLLGSLSVPDPMCCLEFIHETQQLYNSTSIILRKVIRSVHTMIDNRAIHTFFDSCWKWPLSSSKTDYVHLSMMCNRLFILWQSMSNL